MSALDRLDSLAAFLAARDPYRHYRTLREAAFARGTVAGTAASLGVVAVASIATLVRYPGTGIGPGLVVPILSSFQYCFLAGMALGAALALRQPRWTPVSGSLTAPPSGHVPDSAIDAATRAWAREESWLPLDGTLRRGRPPRDSFDLTEATGPLDLVVAAENAESAESSFACTTWYGPGDPRNAAWYSARRNAFAGPEADAEGFAGFFSDAAVHARWMSLPEPARKAAAGYEDRLLFNAYAYAAGRRAAVASLGDAAATLPMLAARNADPTQEAFSSFLVLHEAGHLRLAAWCGSTGAYALESRSWGSPLAAALLAAQPVPVSLYSLVTPGEWFAEHYASWRLGHAGLSDATAGIMAAVAFGEPLPADGGPASPAS